MTRYSLSLAKNIMRRALHDVVDPSPSKRERAKLRAYFKHECAYCGASAGPRVGQLDHADPKGGNHLGNLVLACGPCNGDEKREQTWDAFLLKKCGADQALYEERRQRIQAWLDENEGGTYSLAQPVADALDEAKATVDAFEVAYRKLVAAVKEADAHDLQEHEAALSEQEVEGNDEP